MNFKFWPIKLLFVFLLFFIFTAKGLISLDPDFGWRLRSGQLILTQGIQRSDPFTYTMPSFPWVDHAWPMSVSFFYLSEEVGRLGLSIVMASLAMASLSFATSSGCAACQKSIKQANLLAKKSLGGDYGYLGKIVFLLSVAVILPYSGIRAQVVTWLMLVVFLRLLFDEVVWRRGRFLMPIFFLVWANLHGGFVSGLAVFLLVIVIRSLKKKQLLLVDFIVLTASLAFTLINPYGMGVWREAWSSISDTSLRWVILEWMPALTMFDFSMSILIALSLTLLVRYRKKFSSEELGIFFILLLQGIFTRRHLPLWVMVAMPMLTASWGSFYQEVKNNQISLSRLKKAYRYFWTATLFLFVFQLAMSIAGAKKLSEEVYYPKRAVNFLHNNLPSGEIFSSYNWGGYLIWQLPEKKVFIDGRMPSWRREQVPEGESASAFDDFRGLLAGEIDYKQVFENYEIDTVLWSFPKKPTMYDLLQEKLDNLLTKFGQERKDFDFLKELQKDGWSEVYQDNVAVVYSKPS